MKALISRIEPRETGYRVAQIEKDENIFDVASDFFWTNCPEDLDKEKFWYDPVDQKFKEIPIIVQPKIAAPDQPVVTGVQTI